MAKKGERPGKAPCGDQSGYTLHKSRGEKPCIWCRKAHNLYTTLNTTAARKTAALFPDVKAAMFEELKADNADQFTALRRAAANQRAGEEQDR